jgi:CRISPR-associated protein Csm5
MFEKYKIEAIPLTNIHIGTGKELEPLDYFIKNKKFIRFSPFKIISNLNEKNRNYLTKIIDSNNIKDVASFLYDNLENNAVIYKTEVTDILEKEFNKKFESRENQQIIMEIIRDKSDYCPIIPGSSIKGAIRTAVLYTIINSDNLERNIKIKANIIFKLQKEINRINNRRLKYEKIKELNREKSQVERDILKFYNAKNDPFRAIKITDCKIDKGKSKDIVVKVSNFHLSKNSYEEFVPSVEAIWGNINNGDGKGYFYITIFSDLQNIRTKINQRRGYWQPFYKKINKELIVKACNLFYKKNFQKDFQRLGSICKLSKFLKLKQEFDNLKENEFIIRVGKYSQKENVTVIDQFTKTRMLDEFNLPFGYLKLKLL